MAFTYLIAYADFTENLELPSTFSTAEDFDRVIKPHIKQAQIFGIRPVLTKDFYNEVVAVADTGADVTNLTLVNYNILIEYIKPALVHLAYAKTIISNLNHLTRFGYVKKANPDSDQVIRAEAKADATNHRSLAAGYIADLIEHLEDEDTDGNYPTWDSKKGDSVLTRSSVRIGAISREFRPNPDWRHDIAALYGLDYWELGTIILSE